MKLCKDIPGGSQAFPTMRFIVSCLIHTPPHSPTSHQVFLGNLTLSSEVLGHPQVFLLAAYTRKPSSQLLLNSVQFSRSVVSNSLQPHGLPHTILPCSSPTPGACSNSRPRVGDAIQPSHPLSSPSPPAFNPSQHQGLFK